MLVWSNAAQVIVMEDPKVPEGVEQLVTFGVILIPIAMVVLFVVAWKTRLPLLAVIGGFAVIMFVPIIGALGVAGAALWWYVRGGWERPE